MKGYYIDKEENKVEIFDDELSLVDKNLVELVLPENCTYCMCSYNLLTKLIVNSKCEYLFCNNNLLTSLIVPKNCSIISCVGNNLPHHIEQLYESCDPIKIQLANNLQKFFYEKDK